VQNVKLAAAAAAIAAMILFSQALRGAEAEPSSGSPVNWWQTSSLAHTSSPGRYLAHVEGTLSFMDARGNTEGNAFDARAGFDLRRGRITNRFTTEFSKRDMVYGFGGGSIDVTEATTRNHVEYDLNKYSVLVGGLEHYRNSLMFIDGRTTAYSGVGVTLLQNERNKFNVTGGIGFASFQFDRQGIGAVNPGAVARVPDMSPSSGGSLLMQSWHCQLSRQVTLMQDSLFLDYFDGALGKRWSLGLDLNVPSSRRFSIAPGYRIRAENNEIIKAVGVKPQDRTLSIGIRVSI
jgi:hypothetical protein